MDSDDEKDLYPIWSKFDRRMNELYERETHKFMLTLDKTVRERLGWRRRDPEDDYDRFQVFMDFVNEVYLTPSIYWNDRIGSDSFDVRGLDGSSD